MGSLKSFIKSIRKSKTIAEERAIVRKEGAKIRASFRDVHLDNDKRKRNIRKLLYLYILGEPTYFGQVECLKLLASPRFSDKRIGYLATMLILDESQDILTLLTNSLDIDMKSNNPYIVGLALCTLGNIASSELAKDLYPDVENLLTSNQTYIRKKATIVAAKLIEKEPVLSEVYLPYINNLLDEKSHGVLLGTSNLINSIYFNDETSHIQLKSLIPKIVSHIKLLISSGYSAEFNVKGIPDPFLIVALLKNIRIIVSKNQDISNSNTNNSNNNHDDELNDLLNDLLTQVCAKFENTKGSGYTILYECVKTIFSIDSDSSLKVLGINILSKFLIQKDNNIRYVALDTLLQVINYEPLAVQRHRAMIVGCLHDGDVSIRRRALELTFGIMNQQNIKLLTKELLIFLKNEEEDDLKIYVTSQLPITCTEFNNNIEFNLNTMIQMLSISGNYCNDNILSTILALIMQNSNKNITKKILIDMIKTIKNSLFDQFGLSLITIWCLGEYSDLILNDSLINDINEDTIVGLIDSIEAVSNYSNEQQKIQIKLYILTTCIKLSIKLKNSKLIEHLRQTVKNDTNNINLEIQSRAIEYLKIFGEPISIKKGLLERMPAPPKKIHENISLINRSSPFNTLIDSGIHNNSNNTNLQNNDTNSSSKTGGDILLDLLGDEFNSKSTNNNKGNANNTEPKSSAIDLLADIFGNSTLDNNNNNNASTIGTNSNSNNNNNNILGLFNGNGNNNSINSQPPPKSIEGFNDGNIIIGFIEKSIGNGVAELDSIVENISNETITNISVLCAVSKHQKLQLSSISKTTLKSKDFTTLNVKITGNEGSKIKIRVKISYSINGVKMDRQFDFASIKKVL